MTTDSWDLAFWVEPDFPYAEPLFGRLPEMGIRHVGTAPTDAWRDDEAVERFGRVLERSGLIMQDCHSAVGLIFEEPGREEEALADNRRQVDVAARWGARTLTYHHDSFRDHRDAYWLEPASIGAIWARQGLDECNARFADMLAELATYAAGKGVTVCLENIVLHPSPNEGMEIVELLERVGADNLGYCLDSSHAHGSGLRVGDEVCKAGKWLKMTHFSDSLGPRGWPGGRLAVEADLGCRDLHLVVGLGTIDWLDVCGALREIDFAGPVFFEGPKITGRGPRTLETEVEAIRLTIENWRAAEFASLHLPPVH